jgi:hypothetical protein
MLLQEVKAMVNAQLPALPNYLVYLPAPGPDTSYHNVRIFRDVAQVLIRRGKERRLHWREACIAQILYMHLFPVADESGESAMCSAILQEQLREFLEGSTPVAKVGIQQVFSNICRGFLRRS